MWLRAPVRSGFTDACRVEATLTNTGSCTLRRRGVSLSGGCSLPHGAQPSGNYQDSKRPQDRWKTNGGAKQCTAIAGDIGERRQNPTTEEWGVCRIRGADSPKEDVTGGLPRQEAAAGGQPVQI